MTPFLPISEALLNQLNALASQAGLTLEHYLENLIQTEQAREPHERQLQVDNNQIKRILSRITDGVCAFDSAQKIIYINQSAIQMLGVRPSDNLLGQDARKALPQFKNSLFADHIAQAIETQFPLNFTFFEASTNRWLEINIYSGPHGVTMVTRDVTQEYAAEMHIRERESEFRGLFENALDAILICDDQANVVLANPAAHTLYGYAPGTMNGKHLKEIYRYSAEILANLDAMWAEFLKAGSLSGELVVELPDGEQRIAEFRSKAHIATNRHISVLRDVTRRVEAVREMEQSQERFHQLAESINEVFWLGNVQDQEILYISPAFETIWGRPRPPLGPMRNEYMLTTIHPDDVPYMQSRMSQLFTLIEQGKTYTSEYRIIRPDGSIRWINSYFQPVRNEKGEVYRFAGVSTDVTANKLMEQALKESVDTLANRIDQRTIELSQVNQKLQEQIAARLTAQRERERLATILEVTSDCVAIFDIGLRLTFVNTAGRRMLGLHDESLIKETSFWDLYPPWIHTIIRDVLQEATDKGITSVEAALIGEAEEEIPVSQVIITRKTSSGSVEYYAMVCRDISDSKRTEDSLLQRIATEKELNELKTRFVSMLSHEFRTPLQAILNSSDMVKNYAERMTDDRRTHYLTRIEKSVKQMNTLIEIIMNVGQSDEIKLEFKPEIVDIVQFCHDVIEEIKYANNYSHLVEFYYDDCPPIEADTTLLYQALNNLLGNAMKYSPFGSTIQVRLEVNAEVVLIHITDSGIGIPEEDVPLLFEVFHRAGNVGNVQGKGLGLAIVKYAVEAHSGEVSVASHLDKGTTFTVHLPLDLDDGDTREFEILDPDGET